MPLLKHKWSKIKWVHRDLRMSAHYADPQKGADVKALQEAINAHVAFRGLRPIKVDGQCGRATIARGRQLATAMGIGLRRPGLTMYVQHLLRHPNLRTAAQKKRGAKWIKENPPTSQVKISGNKVTGGANVRERIVAAAVHAAYLDAHGTVRFYSQLGKWTVNHGITGETQGEDRSDCSQWLTAMHWSAGANDPNGTNYTGGWTGTLVTHCVEIRREDLEPGDKIIYGSGSGHHTELYIGSGIVGQKWSQMPASVRDRTIGHGSPPVDYGDIDMMSGARFFRSPS